jgi:salicylate hydroxylase
MSPRPIVIAGAGIAGLTAALALAGRGFSTRIYERSHHLQEVGAGLQLSPNATRLLERLGVLADLQKVAVQPEAIALRRARDLSLLAQVPLGEAATRRWGAPYLTIHRADLQRVLLDAVKRAPDIELTTGAAVCGVRRGGARLAVSIERQGERENVDCGLLIVADGVWSTLRAAERPSRYTGHLAWRATVQPDESSNRLVPPDRVTAFLHGRFHLVAYPVRGGRTINLVAIAPAPAGPDGWSNDADLSRLKAAMRGAAGELSDLVGRAEGWTTWPLHEVPQSGKWTDGDALALIGDAAHAMTPYAAQGAAMAIEDAVTLAAAVARTPDDMASALGLYEETRKPRVKRVGARGAFNRFTWHAAGPVAFVRDQVLALRSPETLAGDFDWLYGWDAEAALGG